MGIPVAELLSRISSKELTEWVAFSQIEPFGDKVPYYGHAIVAATVANSNRAKGTQPAKPIDFIPDFEPVKEQPIDQMVQNVQLFASIFGNKRKD